MSKVYHAIGFLKSCIQYNDMLVLHVEGIMSFCTQPFNRIEIYENGDVYNCCPPFINFYKIGNIFETSFDEIWNGNAVKELRKRILNSDFSLCSDLCNRKNQEEFCEKEYSEVVLEYPEEISISSDNSCNVKCRICRDTHYRTEYKKDLLDEEIEKIWLPILKNAKLLRFGCSGEPFASYKEKQIIKKAAEKYPELKFHFHTNGILANEKTLKGLNVYDRINTITVSLHSASRWTYNKIVRGGKYDKVLSNLNLYSKMKENGLLNNFRMIFVVYDENYKDIIKFAKMAGKYNATAEFWALREVKETKIGQNFEKHSIISKEHKKHKELIKILKNPILKKENIILYPELKQLMEE